MLSGKHMRIALKLAYIGSDYHGSQVQPDVDTVEGQLFRALESLGIISDPHSANYASAGRTDARVHAAGQVVAFDTEAPNLAIPRVINSKLPESIWAWAHAEVPDDFDPRRNAKTRSYRYIMSGENIDISKIRAASRYFTGTHDFLNFCTNDGDRNTVRTVNRIDIRISGPLVKIDIDADGFLWNMVRKIVTALRMVGSGVRDIEWVKQMLDPAIYEEGIEPARAYGLTLMNVDYPTSIEWCVDSYSLRRAHENIQEKQVYYRIMSEVFDHLVPWPME